MKAPQNGTVTGLPETVRYGDSITLTVAADQGYHFVGWKKANGTDYISTKAEYTFTAEENLTLEAVFEADEVYIPVWTLLDQVIEKSNEVLTLKSGYKETGWSAFEGELGKAKELRKNGQAEQNAINDQALSLNQALLNLRRIPEASIIQ